MSDFIFSTNSKPEGYLKEKLEGIYYENVPKVVEYHGEWGSLAVSKNMYPGFDPYETDSHICFLLGGPIIVQDPKINTYAKSNLLIKTLYSLIEECEHISWDQYLSGPYVLFILNKNNREVHIVTDLMSFIPVYHYIGEDDTVIGTHVDIVAQIAKKEEYDLTSIADFILQDRVTYPYTIYTSIRQLSPASIHTMKHETPAHIISKQYWVPQEHNPYSSVEEAANALRDALSTYMTAVTTNMTIVGVFISGGEDSRVVLSLIPNQCDKDAFTFLDSMDREGRIAKKAAESYGANFIVALRSSTHYLDNLPAIATLVGSGIQYANVHTYGFHESCNLNTYSAVFGGYSADSLLKGGNAINIDYVPDFINANIKKELITRRNEHLNYIKSCRKKSAEEWYSIWPFSMRKGSGNYQGNRRLFRSYEPFISNDVVKIAAAVPQAWKKDRKLFQKMAKPQLRATRYLPHSNGWMPYYPWYINKILRTASRITGLILSRLGLLKNKKGLWADWATTIKSELYDNMSSTFFNSHSKKILHQIFTEDEEKLFHSDKLEVLQKINMLQILYYLYNE